MPAAGVTMAEVEEIERRARRAASDGEPREALELYRAVLGARPEDASPRPDLLLRIAELHARLGDLDAARRALGRCLEHASGESVDAVRLREVARACLADEPGQQLFLRTAWLLDRAGRRGEALDLLREVWEKRTGRRRPAGAIEAAVHRLDPGHDMSAWTPEWPPVGEDAEGVAGAIRSAPGVRSAEGPRDAGSEESPPRVGAERRRNGGEGHGADEPGGPEAGRRSVVRRYDRQVGGAVGGDETRPRRRPGGADPPEEETAVLRAPAGGAAAAGDRAEAAVGRQQTDPDRRGEGDDLHRGLAVLEDLIELDPGNPELRGRKVRYAARLGRPELVEEALVGLADVLAEAGAHRGAHLLYDEVLGRLNGGNQRAAAGRRRAEVRLRSTSTRSASAAADAPEVYTPRPRDATSRPDSGPEHTASGEGGPDDAGAVDRAFRRRLPEALDRTPRELEHLHDATLAALEGGDRAAVPWRAHRGLGRYLLLRGRPTEAAPHLSAALDRAPEASEEAADVLYDLGLAHRRAERPEEARACFRRLAARDAGFAAAWEALPD